MPSNINISPILSQNVLKTVSDSTAIKAYGNQLKDKAKEKIISYVGNKADEIQAEINSLKQDSINVGVNYGEEVKKINKNRPQYPTKELYEKDLRIAKASFEAETKLINSRVEQLEKDLKNILKNPYNQIKDQQKKIKKDIAGIKKKIKESSIKANKDLVKQVVSNTAKGLVPIISLTIANSFLGLIEQRKKLEELVNTINEYIDTKVKDQQTVEIATNLRNGAIKLIDNNIQKLNKIKKLLEKIAKILVISSLAIKLIYLIPVPLSPLILKILLITEKLISGLAALISIVTILLANEIINLTELKEKLNQISLKLDTKAINDLTEQQLTDLSNTFLPLGTDPENKSSQFSSYKGFNFKIKEEQNPQFVVKGNKRRYAVAIDRYNVEILKSEYSFTLDPQDLIEQLKLVIDQQNLQG